MLARQHVKSRGDSNGFIIALHNAACIVVVFGRRGFHRTSGAELGLGQVGRKGGKPRRSEWIVVDNVY